MVKVSPEFSLGEVNLISVVEDDKRVHYVPLRVRTSPSSASNRVRGKPEPNIVTGQPPTEGIVLGSTESMTKGIVIALISVSKAYPIF